MVCLLGVVSTAYTTWYITTFSRCPCTSASWCCCVGLPARYAAHNKITATCMRPGCIATASKFCKDYIKLLLHGVAVYCTLHEVRKRPPWRSAIKALKRLTAPADGKPHKPIMMRLGDKGRAGLFSTYCIRHWPPARCGHLNRQTDQAIARQGKVNTAKLTHAMPP